MKTPQSTIRLKLINNTRHNLVLVIGYLCLQTTFAQKSITTNDYLISANQSYQVKYDKQRIAFLKDYNYNLPLIKSAQLRSETNDFLLNKQEYSLRVKPNSLQTISRKKNVYKSKIEKVNI